jgi:S-DNA-T family DNA segregation ATPase FtsK/SpoIIIE
MFRARLLLLAAAACGLTAGAAAIVLGQSGRYVPAVFWGVVALVAMTGAGLAGEQSGLWFEWRIRCRFRAVCHHKGLTAKDAKGQIVYPRFGRLIGNRSAFQLRIVPLIGQTLADWERIAPALSLAYAVSGARIRDNGDGSLTVAVGYRAIEAHEFQAPSPLPPLRSTTWRERLASVVVGRHEDGTPYFLPLIDSHVLIAGMTGSGKGSAIWSLLLGLVPAQRAGVVRFWGFDPKRIELSIGRNLFADRYASDSEAVVELLERAHDEMQARCEQLAGRVRKFEPSETHPLELLVVDELGYLMALQPDRKLRDRAERALSGILVLGRATGFVVVGAVQDPRKETLSFRDLFPSRVAMRMHKPMVDLVLGTGMYEAGALCDLIPARDAGAGIAFVVDEMSAFPVCVRMAWCSDDHIKTAAAGLPAPAHADTVPAYNGVVEMPRLRAV